MKNNMFASLIEKPAATQKWLLLPMSLLFHCVVIAILLVVPLLSDGIVMPTSKILRVAIISAPTPAPVQLAPKAKRGNRKAVEKKEADAPKPRQDTVLMAPPTIPMDIQMDDLADMENYGDPDGSEYGVPGGVSGGVTNGVPGGAVLLERDRSSGEERVLPSHVTPPRLMKKITPEYPLVAIKAHVQGDVILEAVTDLSGRVARVRIINGHPLLQGAALQAVKQWVYEPYIINGYPKPVIFTVTVSFNLSR